MRPGGGHDPHRRARVGRGGRGAGRRRRRPRRGPRRGPGPGRRRPRPARPRCCRCWPRPAWSTPAAPASCSCSTCCSTSPTAGRCPSPPRSTSLSAECLTGHGAGGGHGDISDLRYEVMYFLEAPDDVDPRVQGRVGRHRRLDRGGRRRRPLELPHPHRRHRRRPSRPPSTSAGPARSGSPTCIEQVEEERWVRDAADAGAIDEVPEHLLTPVTCAVVAVATGDGIRRIFHSLGVQGIVTGGQSMNPSTAELLEAVEAVPADQVVILPNNKNIIPVAEQVDDHTAKTVRGRAHHGASPRASPRCWPTTPRPTPTRTPRRWPRRPSNVVAGEVTQAVRDSSCDVGPIADGRLARHRRRRHPRRRAARSATRPPCCSTCSSPTSHEIVTIIEGEGAIAARHPAHHRVAGRAPARRRPPRSTTAASRSTRTSSASSRSRQWRSGSASSPTSPVTELKGVGPERAKVARPDRDRVDPRPAHALPAPLPRQDEAVVDPRRARRRAAWVFGRVVSSATVPGRGRGKARTELRDHRRVRLPADHVLQPAVAGPPVPRGLRGDVLRQAHRVPGPAADGQPGGRPRSTRTTGCRSPPSTRSPTSSGSTRRTSAAGSASRCAARGELVEPLPGLGARPARLRRPHRGVPRHPRARVDARGRGGPAAARVRRAAAHPAGAGAAQAAHRGDQPGDRARRVAASWSSASSTACPFALTGDQQHGDRRDHADLARPDPDAPAAAGRRGRGQDRGGRGRAARRRAGRAPGRVHGADRGAGRAALRQHAPAARRASTVPDDGASLFDDRPLTVELLTNRVTGKERQRVLAGAGRRRGRPARRHPRADPGGGRVPVSLGVVVIDEQHRFGVEQRAALRGQGRRRRGARRAGDDGHADPAHRGHDRLRRPRRVGARREAGRPAADRHHVGQRRGRGGRRCGRRCARRSPPGGRRTSCARSSARARSSRWRSAEETYERLEADELSGLSLGLLHGRLPAAEKEATMARFRDGRHRGARRHDGDRGRRRRPQRHGDGRARRRPLRHRPAPPAARPGRPGRRRVVLLPRHQRRRRRRRRGGAGAGNARLEALVRTDDGFELAEVDLEIRGEGTVFGERQKGRSDLKLASLRRDREAVQQARDAAEQIVDADPTLADAPRARPTSSASSSTPRTRPSSSSPERRYTTAWAWVEREEQRGRACRWPRSRAGTGCAGPRGARIGPARRRRSCGDGASTRRRRGGRRRRRREHVPIIRASSPGAHMRPTTQFGRSRQAAAGASVTLAADEARGPRRRTRTRAHGERHADPRSWTHRLAPRYGLVNQSVPRDGVVGEEPERRRRGRVQAASGRPYARSWRIPTSAATDSAEEEQPDDQPERPLAVHLVPSVGTAPWTTWVDHERRGRPEHLVPHVRHADRSSPPAVPGQVVSGPVADHVEPLGLGLDGGVRAAAVPLDAREVRCGEGRQHVRRVVQADVDVHGPVEPLVEVRGPRRRRARRWRACRRAAAPPASEATAAGQLRRPRGG